MLQFLNIFENVAKTIREKINNGEYDEIIKKHLIDAIGKNN